jgi:hypothetical protein
MFHTKGEVTPLAVYLDSGQELFAKSTMVL